LAWLALLSAFGILRRLPTIELARAAAAEGFPRLCVTVCGSADSKLPLGDLIPERLKLASGSFNLMRNLGGAVGIAACTTILNDRANLHFLRLAEPLNTANSAMEICCSGLLPSTRQSGGGRGGRRCIGVEAAVVSDLARGADPDFCRRLFGDCGLLPRSYSNGPSYAQSRPTCGAIRRCALKVIRLDTGRNVSRARSSRPDPKHDRQLTPLGLAGGSPGGGEGAGGAFEAPGGAIASGKRRRCPTKLTPRAFGSSAVSLNNTLASIVFARKAGSYSLSPSPPSHAETSIADTR
jgi:hypothetical protein